MANIPHVGTVGQVVVFCHQDTENWKNLSKSMTDLKFIEGKVPDVLLVEKP